MTKWNSKIALTLVQLSDLSDSCNFLSYEKRCILRQAKAKKYITNEELGKVVERKLLNEGYLT